MYGIMITVICIMKEGCVVNSIMELFFSRMYVFMRLGMIYILLVICGGIIFGVSPACVSILSLYNEHKLSIENYTLKNAWIIFKKNFIQANQFWLATIIVIGLLGYSMFLSIQLTQNVMMFVLMIINCIVGIYVFCVYSAYLKLQIYYTFTFLTGIKMSAISVFLGIVPFLKLLIGTSICMFFMAHVSILISVFIPILWLMFLCDVLDPIYKQIDTHFLR